VVQTPYGDSGKTTFFIKSESDWDEFADDIDGQELKVMKRINNQAAAVEACITRNGTIVGPFMTDLTGSFNQVVMETELENLGDLDKRMQEYKSNAKARESMSGYTDMYLTGKREIFQLFD
jgi:hypothetical protein